MTDNRSISIIGAGEMGHGLAVHFAAQKQTPTLVDHRQSNLDTASDRIEDVVKLLNEEDLISLEPNEVLDAITFTLDTEAGVADADIVLESTSEDIETKQEVLQEVATAAPENALLASNTSGIPITNLGKAIPEAASRFAGCHWWNPPYLLTPVEVISGEETSTETINRLQTFVRNVDRDPVLVERDIPGFVWNRVQFAVFRECMHLLEEGVASADDINRAIRDGYATRTAVIGPFETIDVNGLDLIHTVANNLYPNLSNTEEPSEIFDEYLSQGHTGVAAGQGFYEYDQPIEEKLADRDVDIAAIRQALTANDTQ